MKDRKRVFAIIGLVVVGLILSAYFYNQLINIEIPIHSDDAGCATDFRDFIEMGNARWSYFIQPFSCIAILLYLLLGPTEMFLQIFFAVKYFVCITLALYLALNNKKKIQWWILPFFVFFCMPGSFGTASIQPLKFHVWTIAVPLICLVYLLIRGNDVQKLKRHDIVIVMLFSLIGIVEKDILIVVTCWIPFVIYWCIYFIQKGYIKKYIKWIISGGMLLLVLGKILFGLVKYEGYGASRFADIDTILNNLKLGITGFLSMFNINIIGSDVLQFNTLIQLIRLLIVFFAIWCLGSRIKEIYVQKIENVSIVDAILAISGVVVLVAYLFGGSREDEISIRYATYIYHILLTIACRKLYEILDKQQFEVKVRACRINLGSLFFAICIIVSIDPVTMTREKNDADILAEQIVAIDELECGMGSFWVSDVTNCLTKYNVEIQASAWQDGEVVPYLSEWDSYRNGNRDYNFFIEDLEQNDFGINASNLKRSHGNYIEKYEMGNSVIYLYDFDIRTTPLLIDAQSTAYLTRNKELEIKNNYIQLETEKSIILNNLYITTGKVRVTINGKFEDIDMELRANQDVDIQLVATEENTIVYEIMAEKLYDNLELELINHSEGTDKIKNICLERLENSIQLAVDSEYQLDLTPGYYIFGIEGTQVKNSEMLFELNGERLQAERINNGRQKVAYGVQILEAGELTMVTSINGEVDELYYQNEILSSISNPDNTIYTINSGIQEKKAVGLLYGPYVDLQPGSYILNIYGEGLNEADIRFACDGGTVYEEVLLLQNEQEHYAYQINAEEKVSSFEVLISDVNKNEIEVDYYTLSSANSDTFGKVNLTYDYDDKYIYTAATISDEEKAIILNQDELCFGPYVNLQSGRYCLVVNGDNLTEAEVSITYLSGKESIGDFDIISEDADKLEIQFEVEESVEDLEIVISNHQEELVKIEQYNISSYN